MTTKRQETEGRIDYYYNDILWNLSELKKSIELFYSNQRDAEFFATIKMKVAYLQELFVLYNSECENLSQSNDSEIEMDTKIRAPK